MKAHERVRALLLALGLGLFGAGACSGEEFTAGTGGQDGGSGDCSVAADCPPSGAECIAVSCEDARCVYSARNVGAALEKQTPGDCTLLVCTENGGVEGTADDSDTPESFNPCVMGKCTGGTPSTSPKPDGAPCAGGGICFEGTCGECDPSGANGCPVGETCQAGNCVPQACMNQVKDAEETDKDCGGPDCQPCADGLSCALPRDCSSSACVNSKCAAASCFDGVKNGGETDVDCGGEGNCPRCETSKACSVAADCASGVCDGALCAASSCSDGIKNGGETDIDCGNKCPECAIGKLCVNSTDCVGGNCTSGKCFGHCANQAVDANETDVDCGGVCRIVGQFCGVGDSCDCPTDCEGALKCCLISAAQLGLGTCGSNCPFETSCGN